MKVQPYQIYQSMMLEVKVRIRAVDECLSKHSEKSSLPPLDAEFCFLQLRKIVEQVCFSSVLCDKNKYKEFRRIEGEESDINGDFTKDWNARVILQKLNSISPHFMPIPLGQSQFSDGLHQIQRKDIKATHGELIKIYKKCGDFMHIPKPFSEDYDSHISRYKQKYASSKNTIESYISYLKDLLWNHAAIGLEFNPGENPLTPGNPKNAWLVDFGDYSSDDISIAIAIAD
ncbi:hypothetical protein BS333_20910 (plasmid) [Vibrio azureus]|uniref:Uncharacterized protein n=1 Tax=Vibrio azureus NBRC 104587 TaxID=1219077 RepID=U3APR5_9VIBR|nr:hypothetical protein [Vibrio azureus]AUI88837.1 hypothetical protein BS333_20910 [Vibrio azureus]GAD75272.1 hypothetical protein VAZ01S_023_00390 [Vibrio azureus NBRC 104587]